MNIIKTTLLSLFLACTFVLNAQQNTDTTYRNIYSFVPQYLINRGIRIDIDKHIKNRHWVILSPQVYLSEKNSSEDFINERNQFTKLAGAGFFAYHRIYVEQNIKKNGVYFSYGATYNYFNIEYNETINSNTSQCIANINKIGADAIIGMNLFIKGAVSLDLYTGLGLRYSFMNTNGNSTNKFNTGYFGYNYTGNVFLLGIRLGVML